MSRYASMPDEFGVLAYSQKNPATIQFLQHRFNEGMTAIGQTLTDYGRQFYQKSAEVFYAATDSAAMRYANSIRNKVRGMFKRDDEFRYLYTIGEIQQAPPPMQRYLMAEPTYRTLYHDQRASGFEETYVDAYPGLVGLDHPHYREVINHVVMDDDEHDFRISHFLEGEQPGTLELVPDQKFQVLSAWDLIKYAVRTGGDDPMSATGGKL